MLSHVEERKTRNNKQKRKQESELGVGTNLLLVFRDWTENSLRSLYLLHIYRKENTVVLDLDRGALFANPVTHPLNMFAISRRRSMHTTRAVWEKFESHSASNGNPVAGNDKSLMSKVKAEAKKMLKIQLALVPVCVLVLVFVFPTPSPEEEKRMRIEYEKNAGWKT